MSTLSVTRARVLPLDSKVLRRFGVRFVWFYLVLYAFPFPLDAFRADEPLVQPYERLLHIVVPWVGKHVLRLSHDITRFTNGSGDTTYDYVLVLCLLTLAAVASAASLRMPWRPAPAVARDVVRIYARYVLASIMLSYGAAKMLKSQFPLPGPERLIEPMGDASPMGLLWTFMGYSTPYTIFAGALECVGGALLFFRRTTTLGALLVATVMLNVVMLNLCYDVPVKLFSSHLLVMALFLATPDLRRLVDLLVLHRPTQPAPLASPIRARRFVRARPWVKTLFVMALVVTTFHRKYETWQRRGDAAVPSPLYGLYEVESFERDGALAAPLVTDLSRWRRVAVNRAGGLSIQRMDDAIERFRAEDDPAKRELRLVSRVSDEAAGTLEYERQGEEQLIVRGTIRGASIVARLRRRDETAFLLTRRGFHWINEEPLNR